MKSSKKIVFIGGRDRGFECLQALISLKENVVHIFCMKEDEHEREKFYKNIQLLAKKEKIPFTLTNSIKKDSVDILKKIEPDLLIVMGWRTIIPMEVINLPKLGAIAVHESLLPKYRGFAPINWVVINGEKQTGVTIFFLKDGIDTGDIIDQKVIPISKDNTAYEIYKKTKKSSIDLLLKNLGKLKSGKVIRKKQNQRKATYTCARTPEDGKIDWNKSPQVIHNLIRGLSDPYPGAFTFFKGEKIIIQKSSLPKKSFKYIGRIPGRIIELGKESVKVLTGDGILEIWEIERSNGKKMKAREFFNSIKGTLENG